MYSLVLSFMYLLIYRFSAELGLPIPPAHTSAIIMILTLKLIGLAFEVGASAILIIILFSRIFRFFNYDRTVILALQEHVNRNNRSGVVS